MGWERRTWAGRGDISGPRVRERMDTPGHGDQGGGRTLQDRRWGRGGTTQDTRTKVGEWKDPQDAGEGRDPQDTGWERIDNWPCSLRGHRSTFPLSAGPALLVCPHKARALCPGSQPAAGSWRYTRAVAQGACHPLTAASAPSLLARESRWTRGISAPGSAPQRQMPPVPCRRRRPLSRGCCRDTRAMRAMSPAQPPSTHSHTPPAQHGAKVTEDVMGLG